MWGHTLARRFFFAPRCETTMSEWKQQNADLIPCMDHGELLVEIMLTPWGKVESSHGPFIVDDESAAECIERFQSGKKDIPIDYEHTTEGGQFATASGAAPAAGWITNMVAKPGEGIFATVKWNEKARMMIQADEYRYLSPVMMVRKADKRCVAIVSAALTNTPAIRDMQRVAAKEITMATENVADPMQPVADALRAVLKLAGIEVKADVGVVEMVNSIKGYVEAALKKSTEQTDAMGKLAAKVGAESPTLEKITAKIEPLITERVPADQYAKLVAEVTALKTSEQSRQVETLVAKAVTDGKLLPTDAAQMTWARELARDADAFAKWEKVAAKIVPTGTITVGTSLDANGSRASRIAGAKAEYQAHKNRFNGIAEWAYVNSCLQLDGETSLTADERKTLTV